MSDFWRLKFLQSYKECLEIEGKSDKEQIAFWRTQERELDELITREKQSLGDINNA